MIDSRRYTALVLAGSRGVPDPVAAASGHSHKGFVAVAGVPMLERVMAALEASAAVQRIVLCIEPQASLQALPALCRRLADGRCSRLPVGASPAASVLLALESLERATPLLVLTADHALLTSAMVDAFCAGAAEAGDVAVGLAEAGLVLGAYPQTRRTLLRFADGPFCGCNLFAFNTPAARAAVAFWIGCERWRKHPWRLVRRLGAGPLLRYLSGRLTVTAAMRHLSARLGVSVNAVPLRFAEAAIDVDGPADLALAEAILGARAGAVHRPGA